MVMDVQFYKFNKNHQIVIYSEWILWYINYFSKLEIEGGDKKLLQRV